MKVETGSLICSAISVSSILDNIIILFGNKPLLFHNRLIYPKRICFLFLSSDLLLDVNQIILKGKRKIKLQSYTSKLLLTLLKDGLISSVLINVSSTAPLCTIYFLKILQIKKIYVNIQTLLYLYIIHIDICFNLSRHPLFKVRKKRPQKACNLSGC